MRSRPRDGTRRRRFPTVHGPRGALRPRPSLRMIGSHGSVSCLTVSSSPARVTRAWCVPRLSPASPLPTSTKPRPGTRDNLWEFVGGLGVIDELGAGGWPSVVAVGRDRSGTDRSPTRLARVRPIARGLVAALQVAMAESGCPASLIKLTSCPDVDCKRFAAMTLCNLTANAETRSAATRGGGLQAAVRLTRDADGQCRRYAATCVCNMANDKLMQARGSNLPRDARSLVVRTRRAHASELARGRSRVGRRRFFCPWFRCLAARSTNRRSSTLSGGARTREAGGRTVSAAPKPRNVIRSCPKRR